VEELDTLSGSLHFDAMTARQTLLAVAVLFAIGEALDSIDVGWVGVIFAVLFTVGVLLMRRGVASASFSSGRSSLLRWRLGRHLSGARQPTGSSRSHS
jgi:hypothetical protein